MSVITFSELTRKLEENFHGRRREAVEDSNYDECGILQPMDEELQAEGSNSLQKRNSRTNERPSTLVDLAEGPPRCLNDFVDVLLSTLLQSEFPVDALCLSGNLRRRYSKDLFAFTSFAVDKLLDLLIPLSRIVATLSTPSFFLVTGIDRAEALRLRRQLRQRKAFTKAEKVKEINWRKLYNVENNSVFYGNGCTGNSGNNPHHPYHLLRLPRPMMPSFRPTTIPAHHHPRPYSMPHQFQQQRHLPPPLARVCPPEKNLNLKEGIIKGSEDEKSFLNFKEQLLDQPTAKQEQIMELGYEIHDLLVARTAQAMLRQKKFQNKEGTSSLLPYCFHCTREECCIANKSTFACYKLHWRKVILPHTDLSSGDCSYLDSCRHMSTCKFVHYKIDREDLDLKKRRKLHQLTASCDSTTTESELFKRPSWGPQWIKCDLRKFDFSTFGNVIKVVMADPPWDIHMDLPYGTMNDQEMKNLRVADIQQEGLLFLWVTGRAMELGRECMEAWGYRRVEEILWVKCNQLQRIIRTGRTGHWLNHSKEHCLVGVKGRPNGVNKNIDCDIIVAEVRETSRKPDEIYKLIERMMPDCLKLELFGRQHNTRDNWVTLGNQLDGVKLSDARIFDEYNKRAQLMGLQLCESITAKPSATSAAV